MGLNYINDYELVNGYAVIDNDFSIITANERMYKFVGISTKFTIAEIIHQVDIEDFINVANSLRLGQSKSMVLRMKRIDNSYRWVLADIKRCILNTQYDEHAAEYLELCVSDVIALRNRCNTLNDDLLSYRRVISTDDELFYIYEYEKDLFTVYNYIDNDAIVVISAPIMEVYNRIIAKQFIPETSIIPFRQLLNDIQKGKSVYEYDFNICIYSDYEQEQPKLVNSHLRGSTIYSQMHAMRSVGTLKLTGLKSVFSRTTYDFEYHTHILETRDLELYTLNNAKYNKNCHLTFIKIIIDNISDYEYIHGKQNTLELLKHVENILIKAVEYRGVIGKTDKKWQGFFFIKDINNEPELRAFIEYMRSRVSWECRSYDNSFNISFSIGISRYPDNGTDWKLLTDKLIKATDIAVKKGGNRYIIYKEAIHGELR